MFGYSPSLVAAKVLLELLVRRADHSMTDKITIAIAAKGVVSIQISPVKLPSNKPLYSSNAKTEPVNRTNAIASHRLQELVNAVSNRLKAKGREPTATANP
jgi:hypothetical protein